MTGTGSNLLDESEEIDSRRTTKERVVAKRVRDIQNNAEQEVVESHYRSQPERKQYIKKKQWENKLILFSYLSETIFFAPHSFHGLLFCILIGYRISRR